MCDGLQYKLPPTSEASGYVMWTNLLFFLSVYTSCLHKAKYIWVNVEESVSKSGIWLLRPTLEKDTMYLILEQTFLYQLHLTF